VFSSIRMFPGSAGVFSTLIFFNFAHFRFFINRKAPDESNHISQ